MAHHDLNFSQCVWRDGHLVGLVDLEMSHANSSDWDIVDLLGMCANPRGRAPTAAIEQRVHPDQFDRVAYWFHEVYPEPFDHPSILQRLRVYDLVYRLAELRQRPYTRGILSTLEAAPRGNTSYRRDRHQRPVGTSVLKERRRSADLLR